MAFLWTVLFSWMPLPLAIIAGVLLAVCTITLVCRILKMIWDALPFA